MIYENYSVLMSVYYKENPQYLKQAIESIQFQTFPTNDFVLVCDGPLTIGLDEIIAEKEQELGNVLNIIRLAQNSGLGNALNQGIKYCKNELVARMDSDDISVPERCQKQTELFNRNSDLSLSSGTLLEFVTTPKECIGKREIPIFETEIRNFSKKSAK